MNQRTPEDTLKTRSLTASSPDPLAAGLLAITGALLLTLGQGAARGASAQELPLAAEVPVPGVTAYDDRIPTPEAIVGHEIGTRHTEPHQVAAYFRAVDASSDRVTVEVHGRTYEGRPLLHAIVTSPENHARLEEIRRANLRLSESPSEVTDSELEGMPGIVYMGYSIHGDEASGTEASLLALYHLAAGSGPAVQGALEDLVVIVDPMFNPDGRARFTSWVNRNRGGAHTTDTQDREHSQPWPGGRTNHYWFDLNRDWLPAQHPSSRARLELFHRWRPQVLTDHHEMGRNSTFFFQPGVPRRTNPHTPDRNQELTGLIGDRHAEALDRVGQLYFSRESYDDYYYGKGSTYPDINGGIGILFEQASSRALETETANGPLHYATTVRNQTITSLSTLRAAVDLRTELLAHQRDFYREAASMGEAMPVRAHLIGRERGETRARALAELLRRHRVQIHELARDVEVDGRRFRAGEAYVIPTDQPQTRLLRAFMERTTSFPDSIFYDVSTWTLPLAYDVDHAELRSDAGDLLGQRVTEVAEPRGELAGGRAGYAYLMEWDAYFAPRALHRLQRRGGLARLSHDSLSVTVGDGRVDLGRGTVIVPVEQPGLAAGEVHDWAARAVEEDGVRIHAVNTGLTPVGHDLGSGSMSVLEEPSIAIVSGRGTSAYEVGAAWHLLSERFRIPVSLVDADDLERADLDRYTTLVLTGGRHGNLPAERLGEWVRGGGTLVATSSATRWVADRNLLDLERRELALDSLVRDLPYGRLDRAQGMQNLGGAIFETRLDTTHPIAYGLPARLPVFRNSNAFYSPSDRPGEDVGVYADEPRLSGYVSEERLDLARGAASVVAREVGGGSVVAIMDDPNFRAFWYGSNRLFLNAIFLGGTL